MRANKPGKIKQRRWKWIEYTLQKSSSCITRQTLNWNPEKKWKEEDEADMKRMDGNWKGLSREELAGEC